MPRLLRPFLLLYCSFFLVNCQGQSDHDCPFGSVRHEPGDRCGYLTVPADRSQPDGPQLRIAYLVIRSQSENRQPDPVVFLQGGPGGYVLPALTTFRQLNPDPDRDFVLFDQRGTGFSGALCPDLGPQLLGVLAADISAAAEAEQLSAAAAPCRTQLAERQLVTANYTTQENAADLEDLRQHLGYAHWNLFGGSYGTRMALTYLDRYPDAVRSAVLLGVFPPQVRMYDRLVSNFDQSLQQVFSACAEDPTCAARYPRLPEDLSSALVRLREQPLHYTWQGQEFALNPQDLLLILHQQLYDRSTVGSIPALIVAARDGIEEPFVAATTAVAQRLQVIDLATYWSVMAGDEGSFANTEKLAADIERVPAYQDGIGFFLSDPVLLRSWRDSTAGFTELGTTRTDLPVLLVAGAFDPITPPAYAETAATELVNGQVVVFANEGHTPLNSCFFQLTRAFLQDPLARVAADCAAEKRPIGWR